MSDAEKWIVNVARDTLVGRRIVEVCYMTASEARDHGWCHRPLVFKLDDGTTLYPAQDDEGNDGGVLMGEDPRGVALTFPVLR